MTMDTKTTERECSHCKGDGRECDCTPAGCIDRGLCRDCNGTGKHQWPPHWVQQLLHQSRTDLMRKVVGRVSRIPMNDDGTCSHNHGTNVKAFCKTTV